MVFSLARFFVLSDIDIAIVGPLTMQSQALAKPKMTLNFFTLFCVKLTHIFSENRNHGQKLKFVSKIEILVKIELFVENLIFGKN